MEEENKIINQEPVATTQETEVKKQNFFGNKKLILAGFILFVLAIVGVITFITGRGGKNYTSKNSTETVNLTSPEATVYFSPTTINAVPEKAQTVDIYINTWGKEISGSNISVAYNPNVVGDVKLTQFKDKNSTVSLAFESASSHNDTVNGVIDLPLQMASTTPLQKGVGKVATLTFTPKSTNITQTEISFSPSTTLNSREGGKVIVLQKSNLIVHYPVNGVFPTEVPIVYK